MWTDYESPETDEDQQARHEALVALQDLWEILHPREHTTAHRPAALWDELAGVVERLAATLAEDDLVGLGRATVELELLTDGRVGKINEEPDPADLPPPEQFRTRVVYLVRSLGGDVADADENLAPPDDERPARRRS